MTQAGGSSYGRIAQLVEQLTLNQRVQGSIPCAPTKQNCGLSAAPRTGGWDRFDLDLALERFPIRWNHLIEKESLKFKELEHVPIEKVAQLFRNML